MIEKNFLSVYQNFGAPCAPTIVRMNSVKELLDRLFSKDLSSAKVLFKPWAYCAPYSRPATLDDGSEVQILQDQFANYSDYYSYNNKSSADTLVASIYEKHEAEIDVIQAAAIAEFSGLGLDVEDYLFLSDFSWVSSEMSFFNKIIEIEGPPAIKDQQLIELLKIILENKIFAVTLPDLVMYCMRA